MKISFLNHSLKILLGTNALILLSAAMISPIYALLVGRIGGDLLDASLAGGLFALMAGLTTLLAGRYADKIKENELIVVFGYCLMGAGFLLYTIVNSIWSFFAVQILIGFADAIYNPSFDALYSKHVTCKIAGRAWGAWEATNYFALASGAVIGGFIATKFGFDALFITMASLCFVSALYIYFLPRKIL